MFSVMLQYSELRTLLGKIGKRVVNVESNYAATIQKRWVLQQQPIVQPATRQGEKRKMASSSLYLDELLGWKL